MTFFDWIDKMGVERLASLLGVTTMTVIGWRKGTSAPKVILAGTIVDMTYGAVTWQDIYAPYYQKLKNDIEYLENL